MLKRFKGTSFVILCIGMFGILIGVMILGINVGAVNLRPDWIFQIIVNHISGKEVFPVVWEPYMDGIIWGLRFPKVIVAACVGGGLSLVGYHDAGYDEKLACRSLYSRYFIRSVYRSDSSDSDGQYSADR